MIENRAWENLKILREHYGETQEELAEIIGVSRQAIQMWEYGTTEIKAENLSKLSYHYRVNESDLLYGDLSALSKGGGILKIASYEAASIGIRTLFPIYVPKDCNDAQFLRASDAHKQTINVYCDICEKELKGELSQKDYEEFDQILDENMDFAMGEYLDLIEQKDDLFAAANILSLLSLLGYCFAEIDMMQQLEEEFNKTRNVISSKTIVKKRYLRNHFDNKGKAKKELGFNDTVYSVFSELYDECVRILREHDEEKEVSEYFIACKWMNNLCNNGKDYDSNSAYGWELLEYYARLGNKYIRRKISLLNKYFKF